MHLTPREMVLNAELKIYEYSPDMSGGAHIQVLQYIVQSERDSIINRTRYMLIEMNQAMRVKVTLDDLKLGPQIFS